MNSNSESIAVHVHDITSGLGNPWRKVLNLLETGQSWPRGGSATVRNLGLTFYDASDNQVAPNSLPQLWVMDGTETRFESDAAFLADFEAGRATGTYYLFAEYLHSRINKEDPTRSNLILALDDVGTAVTVKIAAVSLVAK